MGGGFPMRVLRTVTGAMAVALIAGAVHSQTPPAAPAVVTHDGAHDFDFLIGDWKVHLWRLPDRLVGSTKWLEYEGFSRIHKIFGSNANTEEFEAHDARARLPFRPQPLRLN